MTPRERVLSYVRQFRGAYALGVLATLGYAVAFQLPPVLTSRLVARVKAGAGPEEVRLAVWVLMAATVGLGALRFLSRRTMFRAGRKIENELRNDFYGHLQRLPDSYFAGQRTGDLMSRAVNDINNVRLFLGMGLLNIVQMPVIFSGAIGVMVYANWQVALWVLLPYPLFILISRFFAKRIHATVMAQQEQLGVVSTCVQENASGVSVVRSYSMEERERARFEFESRSLYRRQIDAALVQNGMHATIAGLPALSQIAVLYFGVQQIGVGAMQAADLWLFYMYTIQLTFPTFMMGWVINVIQRGLAGLQRVGEVLNTVPSIQDRDDVVPLDSIRGRVEIRDLRFSFPGREANPALDGVSLDVEPGQTVGIVGAVGAGKSTLIAAIPRLLELEDGAVSIDGVEVNRIPLELLRSSIAMVPQDSFLFSTTVLENIRYGAPFATDDEVREAARRAHVLEDIEQELPHGFETVVGERGVTLSGGQRQRIALARALVLEPSILILDDALSSVDHATEEAILKELRTSRAGRTCFIVAHRLTAVRDADQILVFDAGRIAERGTHAELVALDGLYARTYRRQQLEAELEG